MPGRCRGLVALGSAQHRAQGGRGAVELGLARFVLRLERGEVAAAEPAELVIVADELAAAAAEQQLRRDPARLSH